MKSRGLQIALVIILSVLIIGGIVAVIFSFYQPKGDKGIVVLSEAEMLIPDEYAADVNLDGFAANTSGLQ